MSVVVTFGPWNPRCKTKNLCDDSTTLSYSFLWIWISFWRIDLSFTACKFLIDHKWKIEHTCEICGKNFATSMILRNHINCIHEGLRKFSCGICDKTFKYRTGLYFHSKTVHENVRYQCDRCEKSFTQLHTLKKHIEKGHKWI